VEFRIGTGGWQYFPLPTADKLKGYSKLFDFVEVNSTFYTHIPLSTVRRWREAVPPEFEFSVKCSRSATSMLRSGDRSQLARLLEYMGRICETLEATVLVLQTPAGLKLDRVADDDLICLLDSAKSHGLRLAWEIRSRIPESFLSMLRSNGAVCISDLSRASPILRDEILYTRLFGLGHHNLYNFADEDLGRILEKASTSGSKKAYFAFHGVAMHVDALRFRRGVEASIAREASCSQQVP
jgi:uncharacterized protein YecE (DUF72 family)